MAALFFNALITKPACPCGWWGKRG